MNVSFASERPAGSYALALPVWSEDMLSDRLAGLGEPGRTVAARAAEGQRFERELGAVAEAFVQEGARLASNLMNAGGISPDFLQERLHRRAHSRVERRGGVVIKVNGGH